jgi:hypothetical protein
METEAAAEMTAVDGDRGGGRDGSDENGEKWRRRWK